MKSGLKKCRNIFFCSGLEMKNIYTFGSVNSIKEQKLIEFYEQTATNCFL